MAEISGAASSESLGDPADTLIRILTHAVLPNPEHLPSLLTQDSAIASVAGLVGLQLWNPVGTPRRRRRGMQGTLVPEAAVYEYGEPCVREYEVGPKLPAVCWYGALTPPASDAASP